MVPTSDDRPSGSSRTGSHRAARTDRADLAKMPARTSVSAGSHRAVAAPSRRPPVFLALGTVAIAGASTATLALGGTPTVVATSSADGRVVATSGASAGRDHAVPERDHPADVRGRSDRRDRADRTDEGGAGRADAPGGADEADPADEADTGSGPGESTTDESTTGSTSVDDVLEPSTDPADTLDPAATTDQASGGSGSAESRASRGSRPERVPRGPVREVAHDRSGRLLPTTDVDGLGVDPTLGRAPSLTAARSLPPRTLVEQAERDASRRARALEALASRSSDRADALAAAQARQERRAAARAEAAEAEAEAAEESSPTAVAEGTWVTPLESYTLTATFGQTSSLWSTVHTGLDFAAASGTPIRAVADGTITSTGYDGAYGNKTVLTLADGTEIWFCHQTSFEVSAGDTVTAGETIGTVGATGNVTGPHLHLEVRPGGGDPVDPYTALAEHGATP